MAILKIVFVTVGIYLLLLALLFLFQRSLIYMPTPAYQHSYKQISVASGKHTIEVIILNEGRERGLIYFGGNAEAVVANAREFAEQFEDLSVYLVNYRGYGGSTGEPSEQGLFADALNVFDHVAQDHTQVAVMGRSLGSGVAMHLGAQRDVSHIILITPYDSIEAIAKKQFPFFPIAWLLKDKFDSMSLASRVSAPVLLIAGGNDTLIPLQHSQRLASALGPEHAQLFTIEQAGHNDISEFLHFYSTIRTFLMGQAH